MKNVRLKDIASVQFGLYDKPKDKGMAKYLNAGHFDDLKQLTQFEGGYVDVDAKSERYLLCSNDVILAGKGHRIFAWAYDAIFGAVVPSSLFYIIRTNPQEVVGAYLASVLNSDKVQYQLRLIGAGATITSIPKKELGNLELKLPALQEQEKIVEVVELMDSDVQLTNQILLNKIKMKTGIINELLKL